MSGMNDYEKQHIARLRSALSGCAVLLKANGDFPIKTPCEVALYGSGARHTLKGGTGSGEVNSRYFVTVEQGLKDAGFTITTDGWLSAYDEILASAHKDFVAEVKRRAKAKHAPAIFEGMGAVMPEPEYELPLSGNGSLGIYVLSRISGEGNDRQAVGGDILLSETEKRDIISAAEKYEKFLLVLNVGGPVDLSAVSDKVENILLLSQLGVETGAALSDMILGKTYPSGKLATTWSAWDDHADVGSFGNDDDTAYGEGIYVGYRYFSTANVTSMFPFGYGLSYTTFNVMPMGARIEGDAVTVKAAVKNTGSNAGREVVQLYMSKPATVLDHPRIELVAFTKTKELGAGEETTVELSLSLSENGSYDAKREAYILENGSYILRLGTSSVDNEIAAELSLPEEVILRRVKNVFGESGFSDKTFPAPASESVPALATKLSIDPAAFKTIDTVYDDVSEIDDGVKGLSDEELATLCVGMYGDKSGMVASIAGEAGFSVAGSAGESTNRITGLDIPTLSMADGPAGLRLARRYFRRTDGTVKSMDPPIIETMLEYVPAIARIFMKKPPRVPKGAEVFEQYTTAIPIGTAIAQSFDVDFAKTCGDIVGDEMERFNVRLWLAPALNIHRDIRCGRNFEYYSEDPLVSGLMAAGITDGVQAHKGCGTTIKHYAANNQETNRYANNSKVSERALREIYLRGFEICVKHSQPKAVMTSYNLINGTHTSEHRGLVWDILRNEFGYKGMVMTDWVFEGLTPKNTKYGEPDAAKVMASGNDIFMPGSVRERDQILAGLKDGTVTRGQLEKNASRIVAMARELNSAARQ